MPKQSAIAVVERQRAIALVMATPGGVSFHNVEALADEHGCSTSTIWSDRRQILARFAAELDIPAPLALAEWRAQVQGAIANAAADGAHAAVLSGMALVAKVTGLEAPTRSEVQHAGAVSIAGLSDEQAAALAAALVSVE